MYDKHACSVIRCISGIFDQPDVRGVLCALSACSPFSLIDIGCGSGLRYTGYVLYELARNGIGNVSVHAVDPALQGQATDSAIRAIRQQFPSAEFQIHSELWGANLFESALSQFQLAVAVQSTTLFDDPDFLSLHAGLAALLCDCGMFIDISENDDRVTDLDAYRGLRIFPRSGDHRISIARRSGFIRRGQIAFPAHAVDIYDGQMMVALAFSKQMRRQGNHSLQEKRRRVARVSEA